MVRLVPSTVMGPGTTVRIEASSETGFDDDSRAEVFDAEATAPLSSPSVS